jgi:hypothetical protein
VALVLSLAGWSLAPAAAPGQEPDTARATPDTTAAAEPDTTPGPPVTPLGAFARSFVLPGWGQAEVDQPARGAVYFAAEAASLWMVFKTQAKLASARRALPADSALVESRTAQREDWIVLSVFIALMSGVDAWVSTHLYGFEGQLEPPEDGTAGAQLRYTIPVGSP